MIRFSTRVGSRSAFFSAALLLLASAQTAIAAVRPVQDVPTRQSVYAVGGLIIRFVSLRVKHDDTRLTVELENQTRHPIYVGDLFSPGGKLAVVVSDAQGNACRAYAGVNLNTVEPHLHQIEKSSLSVLPASSRINVVFKFGSCNLSKSNISALAKFVILTQAEKPNVAVVPFWGLSQTSAQS